jgi:DMSO/TMAO reductase YedYZ molybdopterin-dependent catalytic subunit
VISRRRFLGHASAAAAAFSGFVEHLAAQAPLTPDVAAGRMIRTLPVGRFDGRPAPPLGRLLGSGLDARQFADLSGLAGDRLITPNEEFFIRTSATAAQTKRQPWALEVGGRVRRDAALSIETLRSLAGPRGTHLIECAGNSDPANFGLMSVARWSGVPVAAVLDRVEPQGEAPSRMLVTGIDDPAGASRSSAPGASWIFHRDDLERAGAFFATEMNGVDLPADHGFPLRLVVPGWYGCACIKWVSRIDFVPDEAPATVQMQEFARRTHQNGVPALARDFAPPVIDLAATPVRVELWAINGLVVYRVVGVMWGGAKPTSALTIRFKHGQPFERVQHCPMPQTTTAWTLWSHLWRPESPGRYQIVMGVGDPSIRARRLDLFFYTREVRIDEI